LFSVYPSFFIPLEMYELSKMNLDADYRFCKFMCAFFA